MTKSFIIWFLDRVINFGASVASVRFSKLWIYDERDRKYYATVVGEKLHTILLRLE